MNLIVPRFASQLGIDDVLNLFESCLNRVPGIHGGLFLGRGTIYSVGCWNRWIEIGDRQLDVAHERGKIFFVPPVRRGKRAGMKGEIFGEKEWKGRQLRSRRRRDRHVSFYVISQAAGLSLYPGTKPPPPSRGMHDFACAVCFLECVVTEPEMFVRDSLNFLHRQKSGAPCDRVYTSSHRSILRKYPFDSIKFWTARVSSVRINFQANFHSNLIQFNFSL